MFKAQHEADYVRKTIGEPHIPSVGGNIIDSQTVPKFGSRLHVVP